MSDILIALGGCGKSWPFNTTPIQRLNFLHQYFDSTILIDTEESPSIYVKYQNFHKVNNFKLSTLYPIIKKYKDNKITIICGPSWKNNIALIFLRKVLHFKWIYDLYDHENLSSGIKLAQKKYFHYALFNFLETFNYLATNKADILISAINESRYSNKKNYVKIINGVNINSIEKIEFLQAEKSKNANFSICYIGVLTKERSNFLISLSKQKYKEKVTFNLIGEFDKNFVDEINKTKSKNVDIMLFGFLPWVDTIKIANQSDVCLYTFPRRKELDCVYPIKLGEYMALGKPVISVDSSGVKEMAGTSIGVKRYSLLEIDLWVSQINQYISDDNLKQSDGIENKSWARKHLDWDIQHQKLALKIKDLLR